MNNFNKELIKNIKLMHSENEGDFSEEKYSFIKYIFSNLESISEDNIEIIEEDFEDLDCDVDAYYYDEDSSTYNLYIAIYDDNLDDNSFLNKEQIDKYYNKITNFIEKTVTGKYVCFNESSFTFSVADEIHSLLKEIEIIVNIVSNYNIPQNYKKDSIEEINGYRISFRTYDFGDLENKFGQITNEASILNCVDEFGGNINAIQITSSIDFDVYLFGMKGSWLAKLYKEDSTRLLEQNVRSYLKRTSKVNAGILETVKTSPDQFVSFNNGISAVSTGISIDKKTNLPLVKIEKIDNFQIVNGGQTTATLYECSKDKIRDNLDDVNVPVKLTVVKNVGGADSFIRNISVFSNTQTAIKKSDPPSNLPYYIDIKRLSKECISFNGEQAYMCYFERTNGEYETELRRNNSSKRFLLSNPKDKKFDKIDLARAINCWEQLPYITCQGKEKNFAFFNDTVKNQLNKPDEKYFKEAYATVVLYKKMDKIAKKLKLTVKSNVIAHTLSLISFLYEKQINLLEIWEKKEIPDYINELILNLMPKVHEIIINTPVNHPEPRMWARLEECWNKVKQIQTHVGLYKNNAPVEFFKKNDALIYISDSVHFNDSLTWMKLLLWDNKYRILNKSQINIVKFMRNSAYKNDLSLTKKQVDFLKDIFVLAVKKGYKY